MTKPEALTLAIAVLSLDHEPPERPSVRDAVPPTQTVEPPEITPADGAEDSNKSTEAVFADNPLAAQETTTLK